jgi:hypothetical protein
MFWVYKCNSKDNPHQRTWGDWAEVFESTEAQYWGTTRIIPDLEKLRIGHNIIAYQTDRNELVGVAKVVGWEADRRSYKWVVVKPTARLGVKVRPLKEAHPAIGRIPALQPGPIKTLYAISDSAARLLLRAAGFRLEIAPSPSGAETNVAGAGFGEPAQNRLVEQAAVRHVRKHYVAGGWSVEDVSADRCGYDLRCRRGRTERHVEVKGARGGGQQFIITAGELARWEGDGRFVLAFVGYSLRTSPSLTFFPGKSGRSDFVMRPLAYIASRRAR